MKVQKKKIYEMKSQLKHVQIRISLVLWQHNLMADLMPYFIQGGNTVIGLIILETVVTQHYNKKTDIIIIDDTIPMYRLIISVVSGLV